MAGLRISQIQSGVAINDGSLGRAIKGLLVQAAAGNIDAANIAAVNVDASTGSGTVSKSLVPPVAAYDADALNDAAVTATLDGALDTVGDGASVLATVNNLVRAAIGLPALAVGDGTVVAGVLAAITVEAGETGGATSADYAKAVAKMTRLGNNLSSLIRAVNEMAVAAGIATLADNTGLRPTVVPSGALANVETPVVAAGAITSAVKGSVADTWLQNAADTCHAIALKLTAIAEVTAANSLQDVYVAD